MMWKSRSHVVAFYKEVWDEVEKLIEADERVPRVYANTVILAKMLEAYKKLDGRKVKITVNLEEVPRAAD